MSDPTVTVDWEKLEELSKKLTEAYTPTAFVPDPDDTSNLGWLVCARCGGSEVARSEPEDTCSSCMNHADELVLDWARSGLPSILSERAAMQAEIERLRAALGEIASHDNFGLTSGSSATRQCIDELVGCANAALSKQGGGEG